MKGDHIQASVPAPVASLPPREPIPSVHFSMARTVHLSMAIDIAYPPSPTPLPGPPLRDPPNPGLPTLSEVRRHQRHATLRKRSPSCAKRGPGGFGRAPPLPGRDRRPNRLHSPPAPVWADTLPPLRLVV